MKHTIKSMVAAAMAGLLMTSCIDTAVSPELQQLREQQVALMTARAQLAAAQAEEKEIQNAFLEANNAITLEVNQANLAVQLANVETNLTNAQAALVNAEAAHAAALVELQMQLEQQGLDEALVYLDLYAAAQANVHAFTADKIAKESEITRAQLLLNADDLPFDLVRAELERDRTQKEAELAAEEAGLATLESVLADPTSVGATIATLEGEIADLDDQLKAHDVVIEEKLQIKTATAKAVTDADAVILAYETAENELEIAQGTIDTKTEAIAAQNILIADQEALIADLYIDLAHQMDLLEPYQDELDTREAAYDNLYEEAEGLVDALAVAQANFDAVDANYDDGDAPYETAEAALQTAADNLEAAVGDPGTFDIDNPDPASDLGEAKTAFANIEAEFDGGDAETIVDAIEMLEVTTIPAAEAALQTLVDDVGLGDLADLTAELETAQATADAKTEIMAELQVEYDAASTNYADLVAAKDDAADDHQDAMDAKTATSTMRANKNQVKTLLSTQLTAITGAIEGAKDDIEELLEDIAELDVQIADNEIDVVAAQAHIVELQEELELIDAQIAEWQALADSYQELLQEALAG